MNDRELCLELEDEIIALRETITELWTAISWDKRGDFDLELRKRIYPSLIVTPDTPINVFQRPAPGNHAMVAAYQGGWYCYYCGVELQSPHAMHIVPGSETVSAHGGYTTYKVELDKPGVRIAQIDHKMPKSRGGNWTFDNLVLACSHCNSQKRALTEYEYIEWRKARGLPEIVGRERVVYEKDYAFAELVMRISPNDFSPEMIDID